MTWVYGYVPVSPKMERFVNVLLPCGIFDIPVEIRVPDRVLASRPYWGFSDGIWSVALIRTKDEIMICSWPVESRIVNNAIHLISQGIGKSIYVSGEGARYRDMDPLLLKKIHELGWDL